MEAKRTVIRIYKVTYICGCASQVRVSLKAKRPLDICEWHDKPAVDIVDMKVTTFK